MRARARARARRWGIDARTRRQGTLTLVLALVLALALARPLHAQTDPTLAWRTLRTAHFRVHYSPGLEEHARRAGANAERAWEGLARELHVPRGPVDLVIADNVDFTNGYASVFPTPRIVLYAHPPVDTRSLRFYDDWNALVVTHELTHIFHLDRTRGWWRGAQWIFGRNPVLFPNSYAPAWLTEGLAVWYESRLTGSGRLVGSEHRMLARATAREGGVPRLDELSLATSRFPGGEAAYAYGSLLFDYLARTRGAERVPAFVERASGTTLPFFVNVPARRAFGISFARAWSAFRDSVAREEASRAPGAAPLPGWRRLTPTLRGVAYPRWLDSARVVYAGSSGRETPAAWLAEPGRAPRRLGRRNGIDVNAPLAGGGLVYAEIDLTDPYTVRGDLWRTEHGRDTRLTRGARLAAPDVRADGRIVAVQAVPAGTRLVLVSDDGAAIVPLTGGGPDEQFAEPRWSPDGRRVAAVRWRRGGATSIAVLDTAGQLLRELAPARAMNAAPAWTPDGRAIVFSSDRSGASQLYVVADSAGAAPRRLSRAATGLFDPDLSPAGDRLAATLYRARGEDLGVAPFVPDEAVPDTIVPAAADLPAPARVEGPSGPYRPWRSLVPRYWMPIAGTSAYGGALLGASTSARDVVGRHAWTAEATWETVHRDLSAFGTWQYARFTQPVLGLSLLQDWDHFTVVDTGGNRVGDLAQRRRRVTVSATVSRPRVRTSAFATLGAELERLAWTTSPDTLLDRLDPFFGQGRHYPAAVLSGGFSNAQRPALAISPEDGISVGATVRQRWRAGTQSSVTRSATGLARGYKSLDFGRFAHDVLALRLAGGVADRRATSLFSAGGTSGSSLEIVPGVALGGEPRLFAVRGYDAGTQRGTRAAAGSLEWRVPLVAPSRGLGLVPLFVDRASLSAFGDAGSAWCAGAAACGGVQDRADLFWSLGAELAVDFALQYDASYRARLGVALPRTRVEGEDTNASVYLTFGSSF